MFTPSDAGISLKPRRQPALRPVYPLRAGQDWRAGPSSAQENTLTNAYTIGVNYPTSITYGNTHGVCQDSQGRIYIKHTVGAGSQRPDAIVVFDESGKFVRSWGSEFKGGAHGLHINKEGTRESFYLADPKRHLMQKTTLEGKEVFTMPVPLESASTTVPRNTIRRMSPPPRTAISISPTAMARAGSISTRRKADTSVPSAAPAKSAARLSAHTASWSIRAGRTPVLVVADRSNRRLQYLHARGAAHRPWPGRNCGRPVTSISAADVLVIPDLESRVTLLDRNNRAPGAPRRRRPLTTDLRDQAAGPRSCPAGSAARRTAPYFDRDGQHLRGRMGRGGRVTKLRRLG